MTGAASETSTPCRDVEAGMDPPADQAGSGAGGSDPRGVGASDPPAAATDRLRGEVSPEGGTTRPSFVTSAGSTGTSPGTVLIRRRLGSESMATGDIIAFGATSL